MLEIVMHPPYSMDVTTLENGDRVVRMIAQNGNIVSFVLTEKAAADLATGLRGGLAVADASNIIALAKR